MSATAPARPSRKARPATLFLLPALLLSAALAGCRQQAEPAPRGDTVDMRVGSRTFHLEVAATEGSREYGLMNRKSMPADHGMIFVFGDEQPREFWMKNTFIPLDIVYLDAAGKVVSIGHGVPMQERPTVPSGGPMKYAVELNEGAAAAAGLKPGDVLSVPAEARSPAG